MRFSLPRDLFALGLLLLACPFLLFPTVWLPGTAVTLLLLIPLLLLPLFTRSQLIVRPTPLNLPILLWLVGIAISLLITADHDKTLPQASRFIASLLLFYLLVAIVRQRRRLEGLAYGLIGLGAAVALVAPFATVWNQNKGMPIPEAIYRLFPLLLPDTIHPNILASFLILLLPLPLAHFLHAFPGQRRWPLWLAIAAWMSFLLLLTQSRGGYVAVVVSLLVLFWALGRRWLALGLGTATAVALFFLLASTAAPISLNDDLTDPGTFAFRLGAWLIALWMIRDFPFTGVGLGAFNAVGTRLYPLAETNHPGVHNVLLQVGVDLGIPGLVVYLAWLLLAFALGWATFRQAARQGDMDLRVMMAAALAGLLGYTLHGLVDNGLWGSQAAFVPWLLIALIVQGHQLVKQDQADDKFSTLC